MRTKVTVIGAGTVGATCAQEIARRRAGAAPGAADAARAVEPSVAAVSLSHAIAPRDSETPAESDRPPNA